MNPKARLKKGKRVKEWAKARAKLKGVYLDKGIITCEARLDGCMGTFGLSFHHRHKRIWYYTNKGLGDFKETILVCANCHDRLEGDKQLTKKVFDNERSGN